MHVNHFESEWMSLCADADVPLLKYVLHDVLLGNAVCGAVLLEFVGYFGRELDLEPHAGHRYKRKEPLALRH